MTQSLTQRAHYDRTQTRSANSSMIACISAQGARNLGAHCSENIQRAPLRRRAVPPRTCLNERQDLQRAFLASQTHAIP